MDTLRVVGGHPLSGEVRISGSKNAALALMAGALLIEREVILHNVPRISDVFTMLTMLEQLGLRSHWEGSTLVLDTRHLASSEPSPELVSKMRASFYVFGPLLARFGQAVMPSPGGCDIGNRPVNFHINGLQAMGATIVTQPDCYEAKVDQLKGAKIYLDMPSAGATQHLMTTAVKANGLTMIENAAMEPEVVNLANFLNTCGAKIEGAGTSTLIVEGPARLHPVVEYGVIPDRLEAGTFALAAAITQGDVLLESVLPDHLPALLAKMNEAGVQITESENEIRVRADRRPRAVDIHTMPYPGFPTDLQQPMCALLTLAEGTSVVRETLYEKRTNHVPELQRMGADILADGRTIIIRGVESLHGATVQAHDLRGGAALVLAALAAEGASEILQRHHIDRGYENLEAKLESLGAEVSRADLPTSRSADGRLPTSRPPDRPIADCRPNHVPSNG